MLPTVWILGTSGVGKTTVGWRLLRQLGERSVDAAFVDADQLRLVSGVAATPTDLVSSGLAAIDRGYRDACAQVLIVAGLADHPQHLAQLLPGRRPEEILTVHISASDDVVIDRIHQRGWLIELAQDAVDYARSLDPEWADMTVDTTSLDPSEAAARIVAPTMTLLERARNPQLADASPSHEPDLPDVNVITGPGGSGVSTVGFQLFGTLARQELKVGYVDSHQAGFFGRRPRDAELAELRANNTVAIATVMKKQGAERVVVAADPATARHLKVKLPRADMSWLDASEESLTSRLAARSLGQGPPIAGDHRIGLNDRDLSASIAASLAQAQDRSLRPPDAHVINTDSLSPEQVAQAIATKAQKTSPQR